MTSAKSSYPRTLAKLIESPEWVEVAARFKPIVGDVAVLSDGKVVGTVIANLEQTIIRIRSSPYAPMLQGVRYFRYKESKK